MKKEKVFMNHEEFKWFSTNTVAQYFDSRSVKNKALDIIYGERDDQLLDLFMPDISAEPVPVILYIHGGGWIAGDRKTNALNSISGLLGHGWAIASIEYRLAEEGKFPRNLFDVKEALHWILEKGPQYGLDPERVVALGDSAGAHLSLMAALTQDKPEYAIGKEISEVKAVVAMYAPTDMSADNDRLFVESGMKCIPKEFTDETNRVLTEFREYVIPTAFGVMSDELLKLISPVSLVNENTPPILLIHGMQDCIIPYQHSVMMEKAVHDRYPDKIVELKLFPERTHEDPAFNSDETVNIIADYLNKVFY